MAGVNKEGTGARAFAGAQYTSGGKTGTAQVIAMKQNEKYDESKVAERLRDHSWFIAFAPAEQPRIALAVIVENGGWGASAAAPIARKVLDAYLLGEDGKLKAPDPVDTTLPAPKLVQPEAPVPDQKRATTPAPSAQKAG
jgi:penicillin-binding protein 2